MAAHFHCLFQTSKKARQGAFMIVTLSGLLQKNLIKSGVVKSAIRVEMETMVAAKPPSRPSRSAKIRVLNPTGKADPVITTVLAIPWSPKRYANPNPAAKPKPMRMKTATKALPKSCILGENAKPNATIIKTPTG